MDLALANGDRQFRFHVTQASIEPLGDGSLSLTGNGQDLSRMLHDEGYPGIKVGKGAELYRATVFPAQDGETTIGRGVVAVDSTIGSGANVGIGSYLLESTVGASSSVGRMTFLLRSNVGRYANTGFGVKGIYSEIGDASRVGRFSSLLRGSVGQGETLPSGSVAGFAKTTDKGRLANDFDRILGELIEAPEVELL